MLRLCTYIITSDSGLAPNPYWGYCTLAVCTPNHQRARITRGDWIAGFTSKSRGHRLVYAMLVDERLHMSDYFHDVRFVSKKPDLQGDWKQRCGDNFYSQSEDGAWTQHGNLFHLGAAYLTQDTRHPFVFAGSRFWYFGRSAIQLPDRFSELIGRRGIRVNHVKQQAVDFVAWIDAHEPGIHGLPADNPDLSRHAETTRPLSLRSGQLVKIGLRSKHGQ
jgi:Nucleotide modification associated domain 2